MSNRSVFDRCYQVGRRAGAWLAGIVLPLDARQLKCAAGAMVSVVGVELIAFWWIHTGWPDRAAGIFWALGCFAGGLLGAGLSRSQRERRRSRSYMQQQPRRGFPPGVQLVEEIYSALRNLGYSDGAVRNALYSLRARDLVDFDTGFRAAIATLDPPHRSV